MSETSSVDLTNYETSDLLVFTEAAANKVKNLIEEENNDELKLRVFVSGGGCSGFQYGFTFDENVQDGDTKIEKNGVIFANIYLFMMSILLRVLPSLVINYLEKQK